MDILGEFLKNGNFKLAGQDFVNGIIDEILDNIADQIKTSGLDPLPIPDIDLPFSMDNIGHIIDKVDVKQGTLIALLLPLLKPLCGECSKLLSGDVRLTDGSLIGLSKLKRQGPVVMDWQEGAVKLMAGLTIPGLFAPFTGHAKVKDMAVDPDIKTRVQDVGVNFGVEVPVTGGSWMADYDLNLGHVDVDFEGGNLGVLSELIDLISPKLSNIVSQKIRDILEGDVKDMIVKEMKERIPDIKSIVT